MATIFDSIKAQAQGLVTNPVQGLLRGVDNGLRIPQTSTVSPSSLTIYASVSQGGSVRRVQIGAIHQVRLAQRLEVEEEFEVGFGGNGTPVELIPQVLSGRTLGIGRYDLYAANFEQVFGDTNFLRLTDQIIPLSLRLKWQSPPGSDVAALVAFGTPSVSVIELQKCFFTDLGRQINREDVSVGADATLTWTSIRKVL